MAIGIWFLQESPRWLMEKDRPEEARTVLDKLHSTGNNDDFLQKAAQTVSWKALLAKPSWRKRLLLGCGVQAFGQLSGINVSFARPQITFVAPSDS